MEFKPVIAAAPRELLARARRGVNDDQARHVALKAGNLRDRRIGRSVVGDYEFPGNVKLLGCERFELFGDFRHAVAQGEHHAHQRGATVRRVRRVRRDLMHLQRPQRQNRIRKLPSRRPSS